MRWYKPKGRFFWFVYAKGKPKEPSLWLLQGCFFMFLSLILFTIRQQCTIYPQGFSTGPYSCQKSFLLLKKCAFFTFFVGFVGFFLFLVYICGNFFKVNQLANVPTWCHIEGGWRWKWIQEKWRHFIDNEYFIVENTFLALPKWCHYTVVSNFYCDFAHVLNSLLTKNENNIIIIN